jgi:hypothetical protein
MENTSPLFPDAKDMDLGESFREIEKKGSYRKLAVYLTTLSEPQMHAIVRGRINASDMENLMDEVGIEPYRGWFRVGDDG